jgi:hypothetical protein
LSPIGVTLVTAVAPHAPRASLPCCERQFPALRHSPLHRTMRERATALEMRADGRGTIRKDVL